MWHRRIAPVKSTNAILRKPRFKEIGHFHHGDAELNVLTNSGGGVPQACKADGNPPDEVGKVVSICNWRA